MRGIWAYRKPLIGPSRDTPRQAAGLKNHAVPELPSTPLFTIRRIKLRSDSSIDPLDQALIDILCSMTGAWASLSIDALTHVQTEALQVLTHAGLVEERLKIMACQEKFDEELTMMCLVWGEYEPLVHQKIFFLMPHWLDENKRLRGHMKLKIEGAIHARLTTEGERAKQDFEGPGESSVLMIVRGMPGCSNGLRVTGSLKIETKHINMNSSG